MHQKSMNAAVAVLEWTDVDEAEGDRCGREHGIIVQVPRAPLEDDQAFEKCSEISMCRADVLGIGDAENVVLADETALTPQPSGHETGIADQFPLELHESVDAERDLSRLADRISPTSDAVLRRGLALDGERCLGGAEKQECGGPRDKVFQGVTDDRPRSPREIEADETVDLARAVDGGTERG